VTYDSAMGSDALITGGSPGRRRGVGPVMATIGAILLVTLAGTTGYLLWDRYRPDAGPGPTSNGDAERALVAALHPFVYENCTSVRLDVRGVTAAVACDLTGTDVATVLVLQFAIRSDMDDYMEPDYQRVAVSECHQGRFAGDWFTEEDETGIRGWVNCWESRDGLAHISTSVFSTNIVIEATGTSLPEMYEWWSHARFPGDRG